MSKIHELKVDETKTVTGGRDFTAMAVATSKPQAGLNAGQLTNQLAVSVDRRRF